MDGETKGMSDRFPVRHTTDSALRFRLLSNRESSTSNRSMRLTENAEQAVDTDTALSTSSSAGSTLAQNFRTNLIAATDNSPPTLQQRVSDSDTTGRIQERPRSANTRDAQLDSTAESLGARVPLPQASLPPCMSDYIVESVETTNSSPLATEQGVARATALMYRAMERRAEREQQLNQ